MSVDFGTPLSALQTATIREDLTANNIANADTPGFQAERADQVDISSGGSRIASTPTIDTPGAFSVTGNPFDLVVNGDGLFQVRTAQGGTAYTRAGAFRIDANRNLVTADGSLVQPPVQLPAGAVSVQVTAQGQVNAFLANGQVQQAGQLQLARFPNPGGLERLGDNLLGQSPASGAPQVGPPAQGDFGSIVSGALAGSNVDLASELVGQIENKVLFDANLKTIKAKSQMLGDILDIKG